MYVLKVLAMDGIQTVTITAWTLKFGHPIQLKAVQMMHLMKLCIRECVKRSCYHAHYELYKRQDKLWSTAAQNHFGGKNIGRLAALHSKSTRMKWTKLWWIGHELATKSIYKSFYCQSFVLYNNIIVY